MPAARSSSSPQPTDTAVTASGNATQQIRREIIVSLAPCIRARGGQAPLSDRSYAAAAGEPARFPRRGVVHLDLHVLPGKSEVDAARPVAAVHGDTAVRQAEGHRIGLPRQPAQAPQRAGPGVRADRRVVRSPVADRRAGREVAEVDVSIRGAGQLVRVVRRAARPSRPGALSDREACGARRSTRRTTPGRPAPSCRHRPAGRARRRRRGPGRPRSTAPRRTRPCRCRSISAGDPGRLGPGRELGRGVHYATYRRGPGTA